MKGNEYSTILNRNLSLEQPYFSNSSVGYTLPRYSGTMEMVESRAVGINQYKKDEDN